LTAASTARSKRCHASGRTSPFSFVADFSMTTGLSIRLYTDEYYTALGRFVAGFSELEGAMQVALWHYSKIKPPTAQALFSGVRADEACSKIKRIADAENWTEERKTDWQTISARLGILRE